MNELIITINEILKFLQSNFWIILLIFILSKDIIYGRCIAILIIIMELVSGGAPNWFITTLFILFIIVPTICETVEFEKSEDENKEE